MKRLYCINSNAYYRFAFESVHNKFKCQKISKLSNIVCANNAGYFVNAGYGNEIALNWWKINDFNISLF